MVNLLNELREGIVSPDSQKLLLGLAREVRYDDGIMPTELYPHRASADAANRRQMARLTGEKWIFEATDILGHDTYGRPTGEERGRVLLDRRAAKEVELGVS
jgi:hypothetical protein